MLTASDTDAKSIAEDSPDVREYAAQKEIDEQAALAVGMKEKAEEFARHRPERYIEKSWRQTESANATMPDLTPKPFTRLAC